MRVAPRRLSALRDVCGFGRLGPGLDLGEALGYVAPQALGDYQVDAGELSGQLHGEVVGPYPASALIIRIFNKIDLIDRSPEVVRTEGGIEVWLSAKTGKLYGLNGSGRIDAAQAPLKSLYATGGAQALTPGDIGAVAPTRSIATGAGLAGGGDLSTDHTLHIAAYTGVVSKDVEKTINFWIAATSREPQTPRARPETMALASASATGHDRSFARRSRRDSSRPARPL